MSLEENVRRVQIELLNSMDFLFSLVLIALWFLAWFIVARIFIDWWRRLD